MAPLATTKKTIKRQTVTEMKALGTYRPEYNRIIDIYAGLCEQYHRLMAEYEQGKSYAYSTPTSDGGEKRSPLASAVETLRKDILAYSDRLMLNPKAERESKSQTPVRSKLEGLLTDGV